MNKQELKRIKWLLALGDTRVPWEENELVGYIPKLVAEVLAADVRMCIWQRLASKPYRPYKEARDDQAT